MRVWSGSVEATKRDFERPEVREDYERWKAARAAAQKTT